MKTATAVPAEPMPRAFRSQPLYRALVCSSAFLRLCLTLVLALATFAFSAARAQSPPGVPDPAFQPSVTGDGALVAEMVVQPDGKVIVYGVFAFAGGAPHSCIARLNADGSVDTGFNAQADAEVSAVVLQPDGKILLGGYFATVNGVARGGIARLNADGSLDTGFDPGSGATVAAGSGPGGVSVHAIALLPDGRIIVGGNFTAFNGAARSAVARLNADGSLDATVAPILANSIASLPGDVSAAAALGNGQFLIAGQFNTVNGVTHTGFARFNADGSLDPAFSTHGPDFLSYFYPAKFLFQTDGRFLLCAAFTSVNGVPRNYLARFNADGSLDTSFDPVSKFTYTGPVLTLDAALQADNKLLLVGRFSTTAGAANDANGVARFNTDGSLDTSFNTDTSTGLIPTIPLPSELTGVAVQPDGRILIVGGLTFVNGQPQRNFARLSASGQLDPSFQALVQTPALAYRVAVQADGKIVVGGIFDRVDGVPRLCLARINADGTLDAAFQPDIQAGLDKSVNLIINVTGGVAVQSDGKILYAAAGTVGGTATTEGTPVALLVRLNADGSVDSGFHVDLQGGVMDIVEQPDGKILISGNMTSVNGRANSGVARLNADGSLDSGFQPPELVGIPDSKGANPYLSVGAVVLQDDGRILVAGTFAFPGSSSTPVDLIRLNADGSLDSTFQAVLNFPPRAAALPFVDAVTVQPDGRILVSGFFAANGVPFNSLVRLNADGSQDTGFSNGAGEDSIIQKVLVQQNGKLLVGGNFTQLDGTATTGLARLNPDGSLDTTFAVKITDNERSAIIASGVVNDLALQPDGKIVVSGQFDFVNGVQRASLTRLQGDPVVVVPPVVNLKAKQAPVYESGTTLRGAFKLTRTGDLSQPLVVNLQIKGKARLGVDYLLGNVAAGTKTFTKKIKINKGKKKLSVTPQDLGITGDAMESIKLVLLPGDGYTVGTQSVGKIKLIQDH